jgi:hypothetical protein
VVHQLDHGWPRIGCNFNQVQPRFLSPLPGLLDADDTDLFAIVTDQANGADPDLVVDSDLLFFDGSEPPLWVSLGLRYMTWPAIKKARFSRAIAMPEKALGPPILAETRRLPGRTGAERWGESFPRFKL